MLIFDIETASLPDAELTKFLPEFTPPPHPGDFDSGSVKYGNTKDADKRAAKLQECMAAHLAAVADYEEATAKAKLAHWETFKDGAALDPTTGMVLAIGVYSATKDKFAIFSGDGDEAKLLAKFWETYRAMEKEGRKIVGCNSLSFDLPFLVRRSWIHKVEVPATVRSDRYFNRLFVDIREVWLCGQRPGETKSSLDTIAKALGVGSKPEGVNGKDFGRLWGGTPEEKKQAEEYLRNDVEMTAKAAVRLGVV